MRVIWSELLWDLPGANKAYENSNLRGQFDEPLFY